MVISQLLLRKFAIRTWLSSCLQYLCLALSWVQPKYTWSRKDVGSPKSTSLLSSFHIGSRFCFSPAILCHPHTQIRIINPLSRWTMRHFQFRIFSQPCFNRIFSNCFSHSSPAKGWPYRFLSRGTTIFHIGPWFRPFVSWWTNPNVWTLRFWNFQQFVSIFHFHLGMSWYCVCCLSIATRQSWYDTHDLGGCHLRCWWTLLSEYCVRTWIVFYNITTEYNSTFVFLVLCLQFSILHLTNVHQWGKMNFCALRPCFNDHLCFTSHFCQVPRRDLFKFLPLFIHCCFCCGYIHCLWHRNKFVYQIVMLQWIVSFSCNMVVMMSL